jgi:hypothetical protein
MLQIYNERDNYHIPYTIQYFLNNWDRISNMDYIPSFQDILHIYVRSTEIIEIKTKLTPTITWSVSDVGGTRSE